MGLRLPTDGSSPDIGAEAGKHFLGFDTKGVGHCCVCGNVSHTTIPKRNRLRLVRVTGKGMP